MNEAGHDRGVLANPVEPTKKEKMRAIYTSVWDDSEEVATTCEYDPQTKTASDIETVETEEDGICTREYISLADGTDIDTFTNADTGISYVEGIPEEN